MKQPPIDRNPIATTTSLPKQSKPAQPQKGSKYVSKEYENKKGIVQINTTASHKKSTAYKIKSDEPEHIKTFTKRRQCPRAAMQIALLFWIIFGVFYWANYYASIGMVIREKKEYLEEEKDELWHIGYHYSAKDELTLNKTKRTALAASSSKSSLKYADVSKEEGTSQTEEKKKENSERSSQSLSSFEASSTMDTEQSSRAALICVIMLNGFKGFVLSLWIILWRSYCVYLAVDIMQHSCDKSKSLSKRERRNVV